MTYYTGRQLLRMADEGCDLPELCDEHELPLDAQGKCSECEWEVASEQEGEDNG